LHAIPILTLLRVLVRPSWTRWAWVLVAAVFGLAWQDSVVHGDGIHSHRYAWLLRPTITLGVPAMLGSAVWWLQAYGRRRSALLGLVGLAALVGLNLFALTGYREFHGYLAVCNLALLAWWLHQHTSVSQRQRLGILILLLGVGGSVAFVGERRAAEGQVRRTTRLVGPVMEVLPGSRALLSPVRSLIEVERPLTPEQRRGAETALAERRAARVTEPGHGLGSNVLLIVLESTRADYWTDAALCPRFAEWRRHGTLIPEAIAQYPATPLAYGAMFTGQSASVLVRSAHWAKSRPFDRLLPRFERLILTQPDVRWFEHTAITDFFVPEGATLNRHEDSAAALGYLRSRLESEDGSFFAWAHLYEPHADYQTHAEFSFGDSKRDRYRSEVAWLDATLGGFMDWFFASPQKRDTLLVVMADHGEAMGETILGEAYTGHHVHVHRSIAHVPLFLAGPSIPRDQVRSDVAAGQIDLMPTLFDYLGVELPQALAVQGRSWLSELEHPTQRSLVTEAFSIRGAELFDFVRNVKGHHGFDPGVAVRGIAETGRYAPKLGLQRGQTKLVFDAMLDRFFVFDLAQDPDESTSATSFQATGQRSGFDPTSASAEPAALLGQLEEWRAMQKYTLEKLSEL